MDKTKIAAVSAFLSIATMQLLYGIVIFALSDGNVPLCITTICSSINFCMMGGIILAWNKTVGQSLALITCYVVIFVLNLISVILLQKNNIHDTESLYSLVIVIIWICITITGTSYLIFRNKISDALSMEEGIQILN